MRETQTQTGAANINNIKLEDAIRDHQQYEDEERERERESVRPQCRFGRQTVPVCKHTEHTVKMCATASIDWHQKRMSIWFNASAAGKMPIRR